MKWLLVLCLLCSAAFAQSTHGIQLNWINPPETNFNTIYQSSVSGGAYSQVFVSMAPVTSFLVPLGAGNQGTKAFFVVTASTVNGNVTIESGRSNEASATFPVQASAPTGLQANPK